MRSGAHNIARGVYTVAAYSRRQRLKAVCHWCGEVCDGDDALMAHSTAMHATRKPEPIDWTDFAERIADVMLDV